MERASRYICYPSVVHFVPEVGADHYNAWLSALDPGASIGIHLHVPFCERLCWFCACRTQAARSLMQVSKYIESLLQEIRLIAARLPPGVTVHRVKWAGGSPMILPVADIARLGREIRACLTLAPDADVAVEIDARRADPARIDALLAAGMTRAKLFVQDFDPEVQRAIGQVQRAADMRELVTHLRRAGAATIGIDMLYGLPRQGRAQIGATVEAVIGMAPDRVGLHGYAHVPWMAKRQSMIKERDLPGGCARIEHYALAAAALRQAGYRSIGVDHFSRPGEALDRMVAAGTLRHRHLCFTHDRIEAVLGFGASAISSFRQGRVQNALPTLDYLDLLNRGAPASAQGCVFSLEDRIRGRAIEMLMCEFRVDMARLRGEFGDFAEILRPGLAQAGRRYKTVVREGRDGLTITGDGPLHARLVARCLDPTSHRSQRYSYAV